MKEMMSGKGLGKNTKITDTLRSFKADASSPPDLSSLFDSLSRPPKAPGMGSMGGFSGFSKRRH